MQLQELKRGLMGSSTDYDYATTTTSKHTNRTFEDAARKGLSSATFDLTENIGIGDARQLGMLEC